MPKFGNLIFIMSRLGKKPILIPENVEVKFENGVLVIKGPLGQLSRVFKDDINISISGPDKTITLVPRKTKSKREARKTVALWGTYASHIRNMIESVTKGFSKILVIEGVGYRLAKEGSVLTLNLGLSHPVKVLIPEGIDLRVEKNMLIISGPDKEKVGAFTSKIRNLKKPEPYKGKGIRYEKEVIRHKAGKKAVASTV